MNSIVQDIAFNTKGQVALELRPLETLVEQEAALCSLSGIALLFFTEDTESFYSLDFERFAIRRGQVLLSTPQRMHDLREAHGAKGFILRFSAEGIDQLLGTDHKGWLYRMYNSWLSPIAFQMDTVNHAFCEQLIAELDTCLKTPKDDLNLTGHLFASLMIYLRKAQMADRVEPKEKAIQSFMAFQQLLDTYAGHFRNVQFYLDELELSLKQLNLVTRKVVKCTSKEHINQHLILLIKRSLLTSFRSINELSADFHFDEPTNFVKYFKKYTGLTPQAFRNNYAETH